MENKALIEAFKNTYCFYRRKYVMSSPKYTKTVKHSYSDAVIESHLNGGYALAVFAGSKATRFISVDVDAGGKAAVRKVIDAFVELGIPRDRIYVSLSGMKGYHVDIFFEPWIYNEKARNLYDLMINRTGLDPKKVEFRPTNRQAIKLPLGIHAKTGARCWYVDRDTFEPIEDLSYINEIRPIPAKEANDCIRENNKRRWYELYKDMIKNGTGGDETIGCRKEIVFDDSYYESKRLTRRGTRHETMLRIACDLRRYGANRFQIMKALNGFYYKQDMSLIETPEGEVLADIEDIAAWAEKAVEVKTFRPSPSAGAGQRTFVLRKEDVNPILIGSTSAARRIAFFLYAFCRMFGSAHISYEALARATGCSGATVKAKVGELTKSHIIMRMSGGCHYSCGALVRKANTYHIPNNVFGVPDDQYMLNDTFEYAGRIDAETLDEVYCRFLAHMCRPEYLARFLTKPEMERVMVYYANDQGDAE